MSCSVRIPSPPKVSSVYNVPPCPLPRQLWIVAHRLVQVAQLKLIMPALWNLAHHARRLPRDNREARNHGKRRNDGAVQHLDVVLDNGKLADSAPAADGHVAADARRLHDAARTDEDVVAKPQRHVRVRALVHSPRRAQHHAPAQEAVPADGDGCVGGGGAAAAGCRGGGGGRGSDEVAADHDVGLDDGLAAEDNVLRADEDGFAGDLVASVLEEVSTVGRRGSEGGCVVLTVSM